MVALATPLASVSVADTSDESEFWKYTLIPMTGIVPLVMVKVTGPVGVSIGGGSASICGGPSGSRLTGSSPHAPRSTSRPRSLRMAGHHRGEPQRGQPPPTTLGVRPLTVGCA